MGRLTFKKANKLIQEKYPHVVVRQGEGYVYVSSDFEDEVTDMKVAGMYQTSLDVCKLSHFGTYENLLHDVFKLIENDRNESFCIPKRLTKRQQYVNSLEFDIKAMQEGIDKKVFPFLYQGDKYFLATAQVRIKESKEEIARVTAKPLVKLDLSSWW